MNTIPKIIKKELLNEVAGISTIVRKWAKILKKEVAEKVQKHKEEELKKTKEIPTKQEPIVPKDLPDFPGEEKYNDPFYWEDETRSSSGKKGDYLGEAEKKGYYKRSYGYGSELTPKKTPSYGSSYGSYGTYGTYGSGYSYGSYQYVEPPKEIVIEGKNFPEEYKEFSVDYWIFINSSRIEYDHYKSGFNENGEYIVYMNVPVSSMSESAFIHEIKHAYDDWNRMRSGGKPIRDTWEIKNIYTKDFETLILGKAYSNFKILYPIIRYFYLASKLETPAYLENEYDMMMDYADVGRKLMKFNLNNYFDKKGNPANGLEEEFEDLQEYDIPLFKKFKNVKDFLIWSKKYFNRRGEDIFRRVAKMRYVHGKPQSIKPIPVKLNPTTPATGQKETPKSWSSFDRPY